VTFVATPLPDVNGARAANPPNGDTMTPRAAIARGPRTNPQWLPAAQEKKEGTTASRALWFATQAASSSDCTLFGATVDGL
jgi:hypothetical protein